MYDDKESIENEFGSSKSDLSLKNIVSGRRKRRKPTRGRLMYLGRKVAVLKARIAKLNDALELMGYFELDNKDTNKKEKEKKIQRIFRANFQS